MEDTLLTFTSHDEQYIKEHHYDDAWTLNEKRASNCKYLVCCYSQGAKKGSAFCVGLISRLAEVPTPPNEKKRYAINITEYAPIDRPNLWDGGRFPVRYVNLADLGIDLASLKFEPLQRQPVITAETTPPLSIAQAKAGLAKQFGVDPDQIEIVIKG